MFPGSIVTKPLTSGMFCSKGFPDSINTSFLERAQTPPLFRLVRYPDQKIEPLRPLGAPWPQWLAPILIDIFTLSPLSCYQSCSLHGTGNQELHERTLGLGGLKVSKLPNCASCELSLQCRPIPVGVDSIGLDKLCCDDHRRRFVFARRWPWSNIDMFRGLEESEASKTESIYET